MLPRRKATSKTFGTQPHVRHMNDEGQPEKGNRKRATASCSSQYCHRTTTIDELASSSRLWRQRRRAWAASFCQTLLLLSLHWLTIKILLANILSIPVHDDDNNNNRNLFTTSSGRQFANSDELHFYSLLFCLVLRLFTIFDHSLPHYDYCRHYARNTREYIILLLVASHCEWACRCFYAWHRIANFVFDERDNFIQSQFSRFDYCHYGANIADGCQANNTGTTHLQFFSLHISSGPSNYLFYLLLLLSPAIW